MEYCTTCTSSQSHPLPLLPTSHCGSAAKSAAISPFSPDTVLLLPAARHVLDVLAPLSVEQGGPLVVRHISFVEGRGNVIVEYPGEQGGGCISFVGAHMVRLI